MCRMPNETLASNRRARRVKAVANKDCFTIRYRAANIRVTIFISIFMGEQMSAISLRVAAIIAVLLPVTLVHAQSFDGAAKIEQVDASHWKLLAPLTYTDKRNVRWFAPQDYVTDGATIPRPL